MLGEKFDEFFSLCLLQKMLFLMCGRSDVGADEDDFFKCDDDVCANASIFFNVTLILVLLRVIFVQNGQQLCSLDRVIKSYHTSLQNYVHVSCNNRE